MKIYPANQNQFLLTYIGDDKDRKLCIVVNDQLIATEDVKGATIGKFYRKSYSLSTTPGNKTLKV